MEVGVKGNANSMTVNCLAHLLNMTSTSLLLGLLIIFTEKNEDLPALIDFEYEIEKWDTTLLGTEVGILFALWVLANDIFSPSLIHWVTRCTSRLFLSTAIRKGRRQFITSKQCIQRYFEFKRSVHNSTPPILCQNKLLDFAVKWWCGRFNSKNY